MTLTLHCDLASEIRSGKTVVSFGRENWIFPTAVAAREHVAKLVCELRESGYTLEAIGGGEYRTETGQYIRVF